PVRHAPLAVSGGDEDPFRAGRESTDERQMIGADIILRRPTKPDLRDGQSVTGPRLQGAVPSDRVVVMADLVPFAAHDDPSIWRRTDRTLRFVDADVHPASRHGTGARVPRKGIRTHRARTPGRT